MELTVNEAARQLYAALRRDGFGEDDIERLEDTLADIIDDVDEYGDGMTDAEADADVLASAGWGEDEAYTGWATDDY